MKFPDHPFWDFALRVYREEGVGAACLSLQERHELDVNVMLFCLYAAEAGHGSLSREEMDAALRATVDWHHKVVRQLRSVRRLMKEGFPEAPQDLCQGLRGAIQASEIDAEHLEQLLLAGSLRRLPGDPGPVDARAENAAISFRRYGEAMGLSFRPPDAVDFAHVLGKAFPGLGPDPALDAAQNLL